MPKGVPSSGKRKRRSKTKKKGVERFTLHIGEVQLGTPAKLVVRDGDKISHVIDVRPDAVTVTSES